MGGRWKSCSAYGLLPSLCLAVWVTEEHTPQSLGHASQQQVATKVSREKSFSWVLGLQNTTYCLPCHLSPCLPIHQRLSFNAGPGCVFACQLSTVDCRHAEMHVRRKFAIPFTAASQTHPSTNDCFRGASVRPTFLLLADPPFLRVRVQWSRQVLLRFRWLLFFSGFFLFLFFCVCVFLLFVFFYRKTIQHPVL